MKRQQVRICALLALSVAHTNIGCATFATAFSPGHAFASSYFFRRTHSFPHRGCVRRQKMIEMYAVSTRPKQKPNKYVEVENGSDSSFQANTKPRIKFGQLPDFMQKDPLLLTKQKWEESKKQPKSEEEIQEEGMRMMTMSIFSLVLAIGVVYALASSSPEMVASDEVGESTNVVRDLLREGNVERLEIVTRNIATTVIPQSTEDIIAVSIGEGIAGVIGAFATWLLGLVLNFKRDEEFIITPVAQKSMGGQNKVNALVSEAVADGDYFLTRAAAQPLFEAVGVPIFFASLASVLLATLPYEAIKLSTRKRMNTLEEEILLDMLEKEESKRQKDMTVVDKLSNTVGGFIQQLYVTPNDVEVGTIDDEGEFTPVQPNAPILDYVELFADITKWLEYDVLINNYRGILTLPNGMALSSGWESAIFGLLAALSSQLYTDVLYLYSDFGNPTKREQTLNRSIEGWASVYATKCLSAATLFGVYEAVRGPTSIFLSRLVSGGVGGCVGSKDYDLCMETYLIDNPPVATFQADFRALAVSVMNWADNFSWILPLNDQESFQSFVRGLAVSLYSVLSRFFTQ